MPLPVSLLYTHGRRRAPGGGEHGREGVLREAILAHARSMGVPARPHKTERPPALRRQKHPVCLQTRVTTEEGGHSARIEEVTSEAAPLLQRSCRHGVHPALSSPSALSQHLLSTLEAETCPINTEGGTRRVQLVREGGGGGGGPKTNKTTRTGLHARPRPGEQHVTPALHYN